jgi:hypothetical protein
LQDCSAVRQFFQGNDGDVLTLRIGYNGLQNKGMHLALIHVDDPDIINIAISVQIQIIDSRLRIIEHPFKFFR